MYTKQDTTSFTYHRATETPACKIYDRFPNVVWSAVDPLTSPSLPESFDSHGLKLAVKMRRTVRIYSYLLFFKF